MLGHVGGDCACGFGELEVSTPCTSSQQKSPQWLLNVAPQQLLALQWVRAMVCSQQLQSCTDGPKQRPEGGVVVCWLVFSVPGLTEDAVARQGIRSALCSSEQSEGLWGESRGAQAPTRHCSSLCYSPICSRCLPCSALSLEDFNLFLFKLIIICPLKCCRSMSYS